MTLPNEVLAVIGEPEVVTDGEGRLDVLSACRHLDLHSVSALIELVARGRSIRFAMAACRGSTGTSSMRLPGRAQSTR